jgi:hypothetical protein
MQFSKYGQKPLPTHHLTDPKTCQYGEREAHTQGKRKPQPAPTGTEKGCPIPQDPTACHNTQPVPQHRSTHPTPTKESQGSTRSLINRPDA